MLILLTFQFAERTLDAPGVVDDYYLNVLDWGSKNAVSIALENTLYLWNSSDSSTSELVTVDDDNGPITSVSWSSEGQHIAIGLNSSDIQLWDTSSSRMVSYLNICTALKTHHLVLIQTYFLNFAAENTPWCP
jgi:cell division cycle protein 20 (cofactor of APC complex)